MFLFLCLLGLNIEVHSAIDISNGEYPSFHLHYWYGVLSHKSNAYSVFALQVCLPAVCPCMAICLHDQLNTKDTDMEKTLYVTTEYLVNFSEMKNQDLGMLISLVVFILPLATEQRMTPKHTSFFRIFNAPVS